MDEPVNVLRPRRPQPWLGIGIAFIGGGAGVIILFAMIQLILGLRG